MYKCIIENSKLLQEHNNLYGKWQGIFETEQQAQNWLSLQKLEEGRLDERVVSISDEYSQEDVLEVIESEVDGQMIQTHVRLSSQASYLIENISSQLATQETQAAARKLLADTDWMVIRKSETNVDYPQEIKDQRAAARELL